MLGSTIHLRKENTSFLAVGVVEASRPFCGICGLVILFYLYFLQNDYAKNNVEFDIVSFKTSKTFSKILCTTYAQQDKTFNTFFLTRFGTTRKMPIANLGTLIKLVPTHLKLPPI